MFKTIVRPDREIIYVDMDDVFVDFRGAVEKAIAETPQIQFPQAVYKFYENLEPLPDAIMSIHALEHLGYEVFFATRPSYKNFLCYTEKAVSVAKHMGIDFCKKLVITSDKTLLIGHYLIDDNIWEGFMGEMIQFGSEKFPNWKAVVNYLSKSKEAKGNKQDVRRVGKGGKYTATEMLNFIATEFPDFKKSVREGTFDAADLMGILESLQDRLVPVVVEAHRKIFISLPYYSDDKVRIDERIKQAAIYTSKLMSEGHNAVCVNLLGHLVVTHGDIPNDFDYWDKYSYAVLIDCDELHVVMLEGWDKSKGVTAEIKFATEHNIPIKYVNV